MQTKDGNMYFDFIDHEGTITFIIEDKVFKTSLQEFKNLSNKILFAVTKLSEISELGKQNAN